MPKNEIKKCPLKRLCEHCNKEFDVTEYSETYDTFVASIMNCPHCGKRNDIWVTFCKPVDALTALEGQATLEDLQEQNRELRGDRVAGMATERVLAAAHEKIEELQSKLATAVDALDIAYGMVNTEKGYCPQCSDGSGAYYDNHGEVCQCQWCFEANRIKKALAAIRNEGESIKIRPMPDKCTICFAHHKMIASCDHCNGTGKEPK